MSAPEATPAQAMREALARGGWTLVADNEERFQDFTWDDVREVCHGLVVEIIRRYDETAALAAAAGDYDGAMAILEEVVAST